MNAERELQRRVGSRVRNIEADLKVKV